MERLNIYTITNKLQNIYIVFVFILIIISCSTDKYQGHPTNTKDVISLSIYNVKLGDSLVSICKQFPNLRNIPLNSLSNYLPIDTTSVIQTFRDLNLEAYAVLDTTFVINHKFAHYTKNGSPIQFPYEMTSHKADLCFYIKDGRVFQASLFIYGLCKSHDLKNVCQQDFYVDPQLPRTVQNMFDSKYGQCDSIIYQNMECGASMVVSSYAPKEVLDIVKQQLWDAQRTARVDWLSESSVWEWKNARLIFQPQYEPRRSSSGKLFYYGTLMRVMYIDTEVIKQEYEKNKIKLHKDSINKEKQIHNVNITVRKLYNSQDF